MQLSHRHPTLCTLTVDAASHDDTGSVPSQHDNGQQWHLPSADYRNEGRYLYKVHTLDIYFWTKEDATHFIESARRFLPTSQIEILDAQAPTSTSHNEPMSAVVQNLEHMAATGSEERQQSQHSNEAVESIHTNASRHSGGGPSSRVEPNSTQTGQQPSDYVPLAYNPAAPAAPEPIKHREKTPPPADAAEGTGLAYIAAHDSGPPMSSPSLQHQGAFPPPPSNPVHQPSFPGPPQPRPSYVTAPSTSGSYQISQSSPTPSAGPYPAPQRTGSYVHSTPPPSEHGVPGRQHTQALMNAAPDPNAHLYGQASPAMQPGFVQGGYHSPFTPQTPAQYHDPQQHQHPSLNPNQPPYQPPSSDMQQPSGIPSGGQAAGYAPPPPPPVGGYSNYQYGQPSQPMQYHDPSSIHGQVYRPTESEASSHMKPATSGSGGRFDSSASRLEKGVGKFLKKLEKRF